MTPKPSLISFSVSRWCVATFILSCTSIVPEFLFNSPVVDVLPSTHDTPLLSLKVLHFGFLVLGTVDIYHSHSGELRFRPDELSTWQILLVILEQVITIVIGMNLGGRGVIKGEGIIPTPSVVENAQGWGLVGGSFPVRAPRHITSSA